MLNKENFSQTTSKPTPSFTHLKATAVNCRTGRTEGFCLLRHLILVISMKHLGQSTCCTDLTRDAFDYWKTRLPSPLPWAQKIGNCFQLHIFHASINLVLSIWEVFDKYLQN